MKASQKLKQALELLAEPSRWCQGYFARKADGEYCQSNDNEAVAWCLTGALNKIELDLWPSALITIAQPAFLCLEQVIGSRGIGIWNDSPGRKHEEIIDVLNKAIKLAEEKENESQRPVEESAGTVERS